MQSVIKFIAMDNSPISDAWLKSPDLAFAALSGLEKGVFLLHQSIALNYLNRLYDNSLLPDLKSYHWKCSKQWMPDLESVIENTTEEGVEKEMLKSAYQHCHILLGLSKGAVNRSAISSIFSTEYSGPITMAPSFYVPYLKFVEKAPRSVSLTTPELIEKEAFVTENVTLPTFFFMGRILKVSYEAVFSSYKYSASKTKSFGEAPFSNGVDSIFAYWIGYDWKGKSFNNMVGLLAMNALELDANITQTIPAADAFRTLYSYVFNWTAHVGINAALSSDTIFFRRCFLSFMVLVRERYGVLFDDKELLTSFINDGTIKETDNIHQFLDATKASEISVELYNSFKKGIFGNFAELDSYHQLIKADSGMMMNATTKKKKKPVKDDDTTQEPDDENPDDDDNDIPEVPDIEPQPDELPDTMGDTPGSTPVVGDIDEDDESEGDSQSDTPADPDSEPTEDEQDPDADSAQEESATHTKLVLPKVGDSKGIKLELSQGESFDTVIFRFELEHFIDTILANPPKSFSPTKIQFLTKIKAHWINTLSIPCLIDLIRKVVHVPKTFNIK